MRKNNLNYREEVKSGQYIENSRFNIKNNNLDIMVLKSNLYKNVTGKYDYIIFNPPYVPNIQRKNAGLKYMKARFSGRDGIYLIRKFLSKSRKHLNRNGKILLGVNCFYIGFNNIKDIIKGYNIKIEDIVSKMFNTSRVFILRNSGGKSEFLY